MGRVALVAGTCALVLACGSGADHERAALEAMCGPADQPVGEWATPEDPSVVSTDDACFDLGLHWQDSDPELARRYYLVACSKGVENSRVTPSQPPRPRTPLSPDQRAYRGLIGATMGVPVLQHAVSMALPWLLHRQTAYSRALGEVVAPIAHGIAITAAVVGGFALFGAALRAVISMEQAGPPGAALLPARAGMAWCLALAAITGAVPLAAGRGLDALAVAWPRPALAAAFEALRRWATPRLGA